MTHGCSQVSGLMTHPADLQTCQPPSSCEPIRYGSSFSLCLLLTACTYASRWFCFPREPRLTEPARSSYYVHGTQPTSMHYMREEMPGFIQQDGQMSVDVQRVMGDTICYTRGNGHSTLSCEKGHPTCIGVYVKILVYFNSP